MARQQSDLHRFVGFGGVFITTLMWASSGVFIKLIFRTGDISVFALAFYRDLATFLSLALVLLIYDRRLLRVHRRDLLWLAGLGGIGLGLFHLLWNIGISMNGVAVSTVQQAMMPIFLALAARFVFKEKLTGLKAAAALLSIAGAVFISGLLTGGGSRPELLGIFVGFLIPMAYGAFNLFGKGITARYSPFTILTYGFGFGTLVLLPFQFTGAGGGIFDISRFPAITYLWLGGLVFISTLLPFLLYTFTLRKMQVGTAGLLAMAEIPIACIYAYVLFRESFSLHQWIGTGLIVTGIGMFMLLGRRTR